MSKYLNFKYLDMQSVVSSRFELEQTEPKPVVLPLHHETILVLFFQKRCKGTGLILNLQHFLGKTYFAISK